MSEETKKRIKSIEVSGEDGNVNINLTGDLQSQEIEEALAKSKLLV